MMKSCGLFRRHRPIANPRSRHAEATCIRMNRVARLRGQDGSLSESGRRGNSFASLASRRRKKKIVDFCREVERSLHATAHIERIVRDLEYRVLVFLISFNGSRSGHVDHSRRAVIHDRSRTVRSRSRDTDSVRWRRYDYVMIINQSSRAESSRTRSDECETDDFRHDVRSSAIGPSVRLKN